MSRQITVTAPRVRITATFDRDKGRFKEIKMTMTITEGSLEIEVGTMRTTVILNQTQNASTKTFDLADLPGDWKSAVK